MIATERVGSRIYLTGDTYPVRDQIKKALKPTWDGDRRQWWVGVAKATLVEETLAKLNDPNAPKPKADPKDIRLLGKGTYKGRVYYLGDTTRDGQKVRCLTLPDATGVFLDFWAATAEVTRTKEYRVRMQKPLYGRGDPMPVYQTLGKIADFIADQRDPATRRGECSECGSWGPTGEPCKDCGGEGSYT